MVAMIVSPVCCRARVIAASMAALAPGGDRPAPKAGAQRRTAKRRAFLSCARSREAGGEKSWTRRCRDTIGAQALYRSATPPIIRGPTPACPCSCKQVTDHKHRFITPRQLAGSYEVRLYGKVRPADSDKVELRSLACCRMNCLNSGAQNGHATRSVRRSEIHAIDCKYRGVDNEADLSIRTDADTA